MTNLRTLLHREFPDADPLLMFEAGIPVYSVRLDIEVLEKRPLSSFEEFMLQAIGLGVSTRERIAALLGVTDQDLVGPGAKLLKRGFLQQKWSSAEGIRYLSLTEEGRRALTDQGPPPVPQRKTCRLHFDAVAWMTIPLEDETWTTEWMQKEGLVLLPMKRTDRLTLGDFTEQEVISALRNMGAFQEHDITALLELKRVEKQYIAPVTVILLKHRHSEDQQLVIYRNGYQLHADSLALQHLFVSGSFHLPSEVIPFETPPLELPPSLDISVKRTTHDLLLAENTIAGLETELALQNNEASNVPLDADQRMKRLQQLKEELRIKREEGNELRKRLRESQVEFLRTEQHRAVLEQALRQATEEVIIISPWMNRRACNDDLCQLMAKAVASGVRIRIGYGMGRERDPREDARNRNNIQAVKNALRRFVPANFSSLLELKQTSGTHQKILVCDHSFAVTGSFNWLSYVGQQDEGYRNETGTLFRGEQQVAEIRRIALLALSP